MLSPENEFYDSAPSDDSIPEASNEQVEAAYWGDPVLLTARDFSSGGDLPRALHAYRHLVQRGRSLDEIVPDLARLIKEYPQDARLWETLGDALTRSGNPDHAAQAYAQAEKLMH
jgi:Flp pilus assembly protein TadD